MVGMTVVVKSLPDISDGMRANLETLVNDVVVEELRDCRDVVSDIVILSGINCSTFSSSLTTSNMQGLISGLS